MRQYLQNATDFAAECARTNGQCLIARDNILFLDGAQEHLALEHLQLKCGNVVIMPDAANRAQSWLYHTSCRRMTDAVTQIFQQHLEAPASIAPPSSEMMIGEVHRRRVDLSHTDCRALVDEFAF